MQHNEPETVEDVLKDVKTELREINKNLSDLIRIIAQIRNCLE
jgi:hypothetical protein